MARIRSIKPEFWTDETMVRLPFEARLLFIGLWNFSDDHGCFEDEPERIRLQVLPSDTELDMAALLDLLHAAGRLERLEESGGRRFWRIPRFSDHQKIDKPSKPRFAVDGSYKKLSIPAAVRRAVAEKYGCPPAGRKQVGCFYCGEIGEIHWWPLRSGKPSGWVSFSLELDHFVAESAGGDAAVENIVLACRSCNRRKLDLDGLGFLAERFPTLANPRETSGKTASPRESSPLEGKGVEGKGSGVEGSGPPPPKAPDDPLADGFAFFAQVQFERVNGGLPREKPPHPAKIGAWWSEVLMDLNGDAKPIVTAYRAFAADAFWRGKQPPLPFPGFMSQWRKYVPARAA